MVVEVEVGGRVTMAIFWGIALRDPISGRSPDKLRCWCGIMEGHVLDC